MTRGVALLVAAVGLLIADGAAAHPIRTGYLDVQRVESDEYRVHWTMPAPDGIPTEVDVTFDARCTSAGTVSNADTAMRLDRAWTIRCADGLAGTRVTAVGLDAGVTDLLVRIADQTVSVSRLTPEAPSLVVPVAGATSHGAWVYFRLGLAHILFGVDHLLFVLGLLLLVRDPWTLVKTVTGFTVAHSITLALATFGLVHVPAPPLNAAIALSILCLGVEAARAQRGAGSLAARRPWLLAFAFGLLHGLGFASGLVDLGLRRADIPMALLLFNLGVEAGQLLFVALVLLLARAFRLLEIRWPQPLPYLPVYAVGTLGAYWTFDRIAAMLGGTG